MRDFRLVVLTSLMAAVILGPAVAQAACTQTIYAERAFTNGAVTQILGRTSSTSTTLWFATTADPEFANMINNAVSNRNRVQVTGNATSCPTGTALFMGTITSMLMSP